MYDDEAFVYDKVYCCVRKKGVSVGDYGYLAYSIKDLYSYVLNKDKEHFGYVIKVRDDSENCFVKSTKPVFRETCFSGYPDLPFFYRVGHVMYRPYNLEEAKKLVGKVYTVKEEKKDVCDFVSIVTCAGDVDGDGKVVINGIDAQTFFNLFVWLDGEPCGEIVLSE